MAAGINERVWLEWLVKVRVIIITIVFAIEMAITTLTTTSVDSRLFVAVILAGISPLPCTCSSSPTARATGDSNPSRRSSPICFSPLPSFTSPEA